MLNRQHFTAGSAQNTLGLKPIGKVKLGEVFEIDCQNSFGKSFASEKDFENFMNSPEKAEKNHPCSGPILIEGIDEKSSIAVKIIKIQPLRTYSCLSKSTGLLKEAYDGRQVTLYSQKNENIGLGNNTFLAPSPSVGFAATIGDTPLRGGRASSNGGNLDMAYLKEGALIYLPVNYKQALLGIGDIHFSQGFGEISGMALESDAKVTLQVFQAQKFDFPIIETLDDLIFIGSGKNESEARQQALRHTLSYLQKQAVFAHLLENKIYQILGGIGNLINGNLCGKTPTVAIVINKLAVIDDYGLGQILPPKIFYPRPEKSLSSLLEKALKQYDKLPIVHDGDSRQIRALPCSAYGIMRFNPVIYSFKAHDPISAPKTEKIRAAINQQIAEYLKENGIYASTLATKGQYALISLEDATTHIEVVVKEAFAGSPKHIYKNLPEVQTRSGGKIAVNSRHEPYVRFDWRLPHPDDDIVMPDGLADNFINVENAKATALKTFRLVKKFLNAHDLDITDICLFLNKDGDKILTEISPDNMGSLSYIGNIENHKLIFADKDKSNTLKKWTLAANLLKSEVK